MAAAYSDPFQSLANNLVGSMSKVAAYQSGKASYDKSFTVMILGVNQKFTGDIPVEDKQNLISKYSIPETTYDGEPKYFTIKINGAYYVVLQNASFMLYDKVMAYLPNGDWSRMYLDYQSGGKGDGVTPTVYHSPYDVDPATEYDVKDGDYWIAVESAQNDRFKYFKQRIDGEWVTYCSATHDLNINIERAIIVRRDDLI